MKFRFKKTLISTILPAILISGCSKDLYQEYVFFWGAKLNREAWNEANSEKRPKTLDEILDFLANKIIYIHEKKERWYSAKKTIELGFGDCEDIAIVGSYFAEKLDYSPKLLYLIDESNPKKLSGHAVTFLEKKQKNSQEIKYGAIEKDNLFRPTYNSIDSLIYDINRIDYMNYSLYAVLDLNSFDENWRTTDRNMADSEEIEIIHFSKMNYKPTHEQEKSILKGYKITKSLIGYPE